MSACSAEKADVLPTIVESDRSAEHELVPTAFSRGDHRRLRDEQVARRGVAAVFDEDLRDVRSTDSDPSLRLMTMSTWAKLTVWPGREFGSPHPLSTVADPPWIRPPARNVATTRSALGAARTSESGASSRQRSATAPTTTRRAEPPGAASSPRNRASARCGATASDGTSRRPPMVDLRVAATIADHGSPSVYGLSVLPATGTPRSSRLRHGYRNGRSSQVDLDRGSRRLARTRTRVASRP